MKNHKSCAIVYALLANAGQFKREAEQRATLSGVSATRASLCELLATKMLKEFTPRELVNHTKERIDVWILAFERRSERMYFKLLCFKGRKDVSN
jgi:hypothetical protein